MSLEALKIVEEEIARRKKSVWDDATDDLLDMLEARIRDRIMKECVEILEETI